MTVLVTNVIIRTHSVSSGIIIDVWWNGGIVGIVMIFDYDDLLASLRAVMREILTIGDTDNGIMTWYVDTRIFGWRRWYIWPMVFIGDVTVVVMTGGWRGDYNFQWRSNCWYYYLLRYVMYS